MLTKTPFLFTIKKSRRVLSLPLNDARARMTEVDMKPREIGLAGATQPTKAEVKGKLVEYAWNMTKQGYKETTIKSYVYALKNLIQHHADLCDPDSVKEVLAKRDVSNTRKKVAVQAYTLYLNQHGGTWDPPIYNITRKIPFIPTEQELDNLIAGCGKKTSIFLIVSFSFNSKARNALIMSSFPLLFFANIFQYAICFGVNFFFVLE